MEMYNPPTPGEFITEVYLKPLNLSARNCAEQMGIAPSTLYRILNGRSRITPAMAERFSKALGGSVQSWNNLQALHDRWLVRQRSAA
jgi:addiction module HigA family antidote